MTKREIVRTISEEIGFTQQRTSRIVQKTFDTIIEALANDGRVELRNFGVFDIKTRPERQARNPRTGDPILVPEKAVVTFRPGKEMEQRIKEMEQRRNRESELKSKPVQRRDLPGDKELPKHTKHGSGSKTNG